MGYDDLNYETPHSLRMVHRGEKFLIIGSGTSTKIMVPFKHRICEKFDRVIGINLATLEFEKQMDYHLIIEKHPDKMANPMKDGSHNYRRDLPRVLNWKAIPRFPFDVPIYKTTRNKFDGNPHIRKYKHNQMEGLLTGPNDSKGLAAGTASMQALHLASIMGAKEIYMIGVDLMFKDKFDHFYPDNMYRKSKTKPANRSPIIKVSHGGKEYETTEMFKNSADFFDVVISKMCIPSGIEVYDFSDGLIKSAKKLNLDLFF